MSSLPPETFLTRRRVIAPLPPEPTTDEAVKMIARRYPVPMRIAVVATLCLVSTPGCAPSAEEVQATFAEHVATANTCTAATDCAIASVGCPLGCWVVVRVDRVDDVERRGAELVADYERGGARCYYDCVQPGAPVCTEGRCASEP